jgi:geranylgeranyl reductase family protein
VRRRSFETVVVGAGPAGARAACELAHAGRSVLLLEKQVLPRAKTCGGGLVWRGRERLPAGFELPVERECRRARLVPFAGADPVEVARAHPIVTMTMRCALDAALVELARAAGACVETPVELRSLERSGARLRLQTSAGDFECRNLVGADGARGVVARLGGWDEPLATIPALEAEIEAPAELFARFADAALFDFGLAEPGYAWIFPKREHLSVGVLAARRGAKDLRGELERHLARWGLGSARVRALSGCVIPVRPRADCARPGVLLAGDAAGLVDPLTAEGISLALESGRLAALAIAEAQGDPARAAQLYLRALRREILPELRLARAFASLMYRRPGLARRVLARNGRAACEVLTDIVCGTRSYRALLRDPRAWLALAGLPLRGRAAATA